MSYATFIEMAQKVSRAGNIEQISQLATTSILTGNFSKTPQGFTRAVESAQRRLSITLNTADTVKAIGKIQRNVQVHSV